VLVIGNQPMWGNWIYPRGARMRRENDSTWIQESRFHTHTQLSFKVTRGSYYKEALYDNKGQTPPAVTFNAIADTIVVLRPSAWNDLYQRSITGTVRYHHNFGSVFLKYTRDVTVWLPPSYFKTPAKRYPVLYAHDGQNIFDHTGGAGDEWHMDEVADSLIRKGAVEEFIIVGIANTRDRMIEYSGAPEGYNYVKFIATELKPFIDKEYRTRSDKMNTAAIGSSMGGLISFYMLWLYPEVFSKAACLSSGFYFDDGDITRQLEKSTARLAGSRIYLDCGGLDLDSDFLPSNEHVRDLLQNNRSIGFQYRYFPNDSHNEYAWAKRLYMPLVFLFGK